MASKYPPYVNAYRNISKIFEGIKKAAVPTKFTTDFMGSVLGLKSSSYRAMIPLLKKLEFIDQSNVPTENYKNYRGNSKVGKAVLADSIRKAYSDLYNSNEYAHRASGQELTNLIKLASGVADDAQNLPAAVGSFEELCKLADFESTVDTGEAPNGIQSSASSPASGDHRETPPVDHRKLNMGISYTVNLNLPATTEIEVFNAIFKSLKENILDD